MITKVKDLVFQTTFNSFTPLDNIGSGGSGNVYKVQDIKGDIFALKYLWPERINSNRIRRFKNELSFCYKNKHPNIITVADWGFININDTKCPFYIMPYYEKTLRQLIDKEIRQNIVLKYFSQILDGIEAAHLEGIFHRDLKPENILYDSPSDSLVIADFGIAHFTEEHLQTLVKTKAQERLASFQYAAPEQRVKKTQVDHRADIYALGMILNEMFTKILPYGTDFKKVGEVHTNYEYIDEIVNTMLKQSPDHRPANIDEIKQKLIARKNEFISRQRLSKLKHKVIPKSEIDDPLLNNPIKLIGIDYRNGQLRLQLNQLVDPKWEHAFKTFSDFSYIQGYSPLEFTFHRDSATIQVPERLVQKITDHFNNYLAKCNNYYKEILISEKEKFEREEKIRLQNAIEEEERRQRIIKNTRI